MIEIIIAAYLIVGFFVALLLWTVLVISKRSDAGQMAKSEFMNSEAQLAPIEEPIYQADRL